MRVAIVSSDEVYLRGLVAVLTEADMTVVAATTSLEGPLPPADAVVIDAGANADTEPGLDARIVHLARTTRVLVLTTDGGTSFPAGRLAGDVTVLDRRTTAETLRTAVRGAASGRSSQCTVVTRSPSATEALDSERGILSKREHQVLWQIAEGRTQGQIARALGISQHTVDSYIRRIRAKLDLGNKAELTRAAMLGHLGPAPGAVERPAQGRGGKAA